MVGRRGEEEGVGGAAVQDLNAAAVFALVVAHDLAVEAALVGGQDVAVPVGLANRHPVGHHGEVHLRARAGVLICAQLGIVPAADRVGLLPELVVVPFTSRGRVTAAHGCLGLLSALPEQRRDRPGVAGVAVRSGPGRVEGHLDWDGVGGAGADVCGVTAGGGVGDVQGHEGLSTSAEGLHQGCVPDLAVGQILHPWGVGNEVFKLGRVRVLTAPAIEHEDLGEQHGWDKGKHLPTGFGAEGVDQPLVGGNVDQLLSFELRRLQEVVAWHRGPGGRRPDGRRRGVDERPQPPGAPLTPEPLDQAGEQGIIRWRPGPDRPDGGEVDRARVVPQGHDVHASGGRGEDLAVVPVGQAHQEAARFPALVVDSGGQLGQVEGAQMPLPGRELGGGHDGRVAGDGGTGAGGDRGGGGGVLTGERAVEHRADVIHQLLFVVGGEGRAAVVCSVSVVAQISDLVHLRQRGGVGHTGQGQGVGLDRVAGEAVVKGRGGWEGVVTRLTIGQHQHEARAAGRMDVRGVAGLEVRVRRRDRRPGGRATYGVEPAVVLVGEPVEDPADLIVGLALSGDVDQRHPHRARGAIADAVAGV